MVRSSDGVEIAYARHGAGTPTVVLVHGWAGDRSCWDHQIDFLAEHHDVVAVDLGGHGESGLGRTDWNMQAFGEDVLAVVEEVGVQQVVLVGHSMGGDAVAHAAAKLDGRVVGLVWVDTYRSLGDETGAPPEAVGAFVQPFRDDFAGAVAGFVANMFPANADPELIDGIATGMAAAPRAMALSSLAHAPTREPAVLAALSRIKAPVVAINPDLGPTDVDSMRLHGVEPIVLPGVGHFMMVEDPDRFNAVLAETLVRFGE